MSELRVPDPGATTGDEVRVCSPTEERHAASADLDRRPTLDVLGLLNEADAQVAPAVARTLPDLARLVDATVERVRAGGRVHYVGAGTSGRLAVLDAAELPPTFDLAPGVVLAHHAGGPDALVQAAPGVEDDADAGRRALADVTELDVVVGLTASGRTPYVRGALERAREVGALTALVTSHPDSVLVPLADHVVAPDTGPEVVTGSTRLKAGTAQKLVLNGFSTALMVRLGHTYGNLMVGVAPTNAKLRGRAVRILCEAAGVDEPTARQALAAADDELKPALLTLLAHVPVAVARDALREARGSLASALTGLTSLTLVPPLPPEPPGRLEQVEPLEALEHGAPYVPGVGPDTALVS